MLDIFLGLLLLKEEGEDSSVLQFSSEDCRLRDT